MNMSHEEGEVEITDPEDEFLGNMKLGMFCSVDEIEELLGAEREIIERRPVTETALSGFC